MKRSTDRRYRKTLLICALASASILAWSAPAMAVVADNTVVSSSIVNGSVKAADIAKAAVTAAKIANGAITAAKLANGSVVAAKIAAAAVTTDKLAAAAVTSAKVADGTLVDGDIAAGAAIAASKINRAGLDADLLDGKHAADFAAAAHNHDASYSGVGHDHDAAYSALTHDHDSDYLNTSGSDAMNGTLTAGGYDYGSVQTGYLSIPAAALYPKNNSDSYFTTANYRWTTTAGDITFEAPVNLPQGATVTGLTALAFDNNGTYDETIAVERVTNQMSIATMASVSTSNSAAAWVSVSDPSISWATIDNSAYAYKVSVRQRGEAAGNVMFSTITITYTFTKPGS